MTEKRSHTIARRLRSTICALGVLALAAIAPLVPVARAQDSPRAKELGQKLMCVCGCNQILGSCNHVGCTYSHDMMKELEDRIARNEPDDLTLQAFVQEYGPTVLSSPPAKGFNRIAWIAPIVFPLIALVVLWDVVRRWKHKGAVATASGPRVSPDLIARAQRESDKDEEA
ncbi:MAG TPA: cytochrome c-type biogenesis protein CcmH [Candidatus Dormibacteraeota bacterium]|nr:cytochrome c-type biogenesis protein CcmH [Candidatus Dormibacteraeota bacterium]